MNIRGLKYLISVERHRHFGKAAEECFVSQPALSMQLKKLENELGVKIFERSNKRVMITQVGQMLVDKAKDILQYSNEMLEISKNFHDPLAGDIKIGAFPTLAPYFLPKIISPIITNFPKLKLFLLEEKTKIIIDNLINGQIDMAFLAVPLPIDNDAFIIEELFCEPFYLAVPKTHRFANLKYVHDALLKDEKLLLLQEGHCLRDQALDICSMMGASENQDFRATSMETLRQMVAANVGITLIPKLAMKDNDGISYIPFLNSNPSRTIAMIYRKTYSRKGLIDKLLPVINNELGGFLA